ncbi:MAG: hypothetical protein GY940_08270, partial [bacterium]|nr:hypothetical protein [bacterium]
MKTLLNLNICFIISFIAVLTIGCGKGERKVEYYKDGSQKEVVQLKEGKRHGKTIKFYKNGQK